MLLAVWAVCFQDSKLLGSGKSSPGNVTQMEGYEPIKLYSQKQVGLDLAQSYMQQGFSQRGLSTSSIAWELPEMPILRTYLGPRSPQLRVGPRS